MNDRAVLIVAAVLAAVLVSVGVLWELRDYAHPVFVNGHDAAHHADIKVTDMIAARFPGIRVGSARCPPLVDLTGERSARCVVPIEGEELALDVTVSRSGHGIDFNDDGALFVTRDAERTIGRELEEMYGEQFTVRCPGAAVRVLAPGARVSCAVEAPDTLRRELEVGVTGDRGAVHFQELAGITTRAERILGAAGAQREGSVTIAGSALERYLRGSAAALDGGEVGRRGLVGAAHCPPRLVLHEGTHARCTVAAGGVTLPYDVHFEKGLGLRADFGDSVMVIGALRNFALRYFQRRRLDAHIPYQVDVNCGTAQVVVQQLGTTLTCRIIFGGETSYFAFRFLDADGGFTMEESAGPEDSTWKEP